MGIRGLILEGRPCHIITSDVEHSCVHATIKSLETLGHYTTFLKPGLYGAVTPEAVRAAITPETKLIALMAVNNETGVKTDIKAIGQIAHEHHIPFFVDGVALLGKEPFEIHLGVSMISFSGHKCHAPQGVGFCYIRSGIKCRPLLTGGEQEYGRRAGTENVIGIAALGKSIELLAEELPAAARRMELLRQKFEATILAALPHASINGQGPRTTNVSNIAFAGVDGETLLMELDRDGVAASHGSACASGSLEPSRVLLNMGIPLELVRSSIRFSLSRLNTEEEIDRAAQIVIFRSRQRSSSS
jgi:cysteine desulfurase